jgi:hypothetical protein
LRGKPPDELLAHHRPVLPCQPWGNGYAGHLCGDNKDDKYSGDVSDPYNAVRLLKLNPELTFGVQGSTGTISEVADP